ncbi:hypothetical protein CGRA01v4_03595 [Colletotrichum graminicola]|nr:hypothetical protein CGRA01v4_03595 [Colletotrichum graminicola]
MLKMAFGWETPANVDTCRSMISVDGDRAACADQPKQARSAPLVLSVLSFAEQSRQPPLSDLLLRRRLSSLARMLCAQPAAMSTEGSSRGHGRTRAKEGT